MITIQPQTTQGWKWDQGSSLYAADAVDIKSQVLEVGQASEGLVGYGFEPVGYKI